MTTCADIRPFTLNDRMLKPFRRILDRSLQPDCAQRNLSLIHGLTFFWTLFSHKTKAATILHRHFPPPKSIPTKYIIFFFFSFLNIYMERNKGSPFCSDWCSGLRIRMVCNPKVRKLWWQRAEFLANNPSVVRMQGAQLHLGLTFTPSGLWAPAVRLCVWSLVNSSQAF